MRRLVPAVLLLAGLAAPALAQPQTPPAPARAPAPVNASTLPDLDGGPPASTQVAVLSGLHVTLQQAEVVMTRIRDAELPKENGALRSIRPALKFKGTDWFPRKY